MATFEVLVGEAEKTLRTLPDGAFNTCITSPPYYGLRNYGDLDEQVGLEETPDEYVERLVGIFREVRRVLADDGTLWLNIGDTYASTSGAGVPEGMKPKDLIGIPWMVATALRADGWFLRQDIIWAKRNPMPHPLQDRCVTAHEYLFLLAKSEKYRFDRDAIMEVANDTTTDGNRFGGAKYNDPENMVKRGSIYTNKGTRLKRSVWTTSLSPFAGGHFAPFPPALIEPCILAGCPRGGHVLDPFGGSGTTAGVAIDNDRNATIIELNPEYAALVEDRVEGIIGYRLERGDPSVERPGFDTWFPTIDEQKH